MYYLGFDEYETKLEVELVKKISRITRTRNPRDTMGEIRRQKREVRAEIRRIENELKLYQQQLVKLAYYNETTERKL